MAALTVSSYQTVADLYAFAEIQVVGLTSYYFDAAYEILIQQDFDPELDLLSPFHQAYLGAESAFLQTPQAVIQAVTALQQHILNKAETTAGVKFTDINVWIKATGGRGDGEVDQDAFRVEPKFAQLSAKAGFAINAENLG